MAAKQLGKLSLKLCHKAKFHSVLLYHLNDFTGTQESPEPCAKASVKQKYSASKLFRAHSLFSCCFSPDLASAQKLELLWYQTSLVEAPGHQSCGSDPVWFQQHKWWHFSCFTEFQWVWILLDEGNNRGDLTRALSYRWCSRGAQQRFPARRVMGCDTLEVTLSFSWAFIGVGWRLKLDRKKQRMTTSCGNWLQ